MRELVYLNEIVKVKGGKRLPKGHELLSNITNHKYIRARDIKEGKINFDQPVYISNETHEQIKNYIVHTGDIILTIAGTIGEVGLVTEEFNHSNLTENAVKIQADSSRVSNVYLKYYLGSKAVYDYFHLLASGAAQPKLGIYKILSTKINLPTLETQKKIATILSGYDDLIENNLKRIKILEEMAQQTYEEWFVRMRFPGASAPLSHQEEKKSLSHQQNLTETSETERSRSLPEGDALSLPKGDALSLPKGWEKVKIEDLCMVSGGGTPSKNNEEYWIDGDINWFTPTDLTKNKSLVITDSELKTNSLGISKSSAKILQSDSFIMTSRATIGVFALLDKPFSTNQGFINITPNHKNLKGYLLYNFIFRMDQLKGLATGATFPELSKSKFKVLDIIKPSDEVLNQFSEYFDVITKQLFNLTYQNQRLREARDILLPRLMMGMIEV